MGREFGQDNEEQPVEWGERQKKKPLYLRLGAIIIIIIVVVTLAVSLSRKRDYYSGSNNVNELDFHEILPFYTRVALEDPTSPQSLAWYWLKVDPSYQKYNNGRRLLRFVFATLFYATNGETSWTTNTDWLSYDVHECEWYSSAKQPTLCHNLDLRNNGLEGTIPPEIGLLGSSLISHNNHVDRLVLSRNHKLVGSIPSQISLLSHVTNIHLEHCGLTGTLPSALYDQDKSKLLDGLESLQVHNNSLTGTLPFGMSHLTNLKMLSLHRNHNITGTIPSEFGLLTHLTRLHLNDMNLTVTPIPSTLGSLTNLLDLHIQHNSKLLSSSPPVKKNHYEIPMEVCSLFKIGKLTDLTIDCDTIQCSCDCTCG